ncbi:speckle-type POZ protein [Parasteatoda tepidariorum]|uniref:speckle-type POZ protein n=1 Tax=Parasteatoda tepidariorum TaxID=114398 RepID=UPI00077FD7E2|nr:speckle-type POZ protein-like [Parasteatoda tepidariorum]
MALRRKNEYMFTWRIENYSFCYQNNGECLFSPNFIDENLSGKEWFLQLFPRGESEMTSEYVSCYLFQDSLDESSFSFDLKIEMVGASGKKLKTFEVTNKSTGNECKWGSSEFIETREIMEDAEKSADDVLTVYCYLYGESFRKLKSEESIARTRIGVDRLSLRWNVFCKNGMVLEDIIFPRGIKFLFTISKTDNSLKINVKILKSKIKLCYYVDCKLTLLDARDKEACTERSSHLFQLKHPFEIWEFPSVAFAHELVRNKKDYAENKAIAFLCEFSCSNATESNILSVFDDVTRISSLQEDFKCMFLSKKFCDVKLSVENHVIEAHKSVLAARSPIFCAMFDMNMIETLTGTVKIVDIDYNTVNLFLEFLYTDNVGVIDFERAKKLLIVADKYQVLTLKEKCSIFLNCKMSLTNVYEILVLADTISHARLKAAAIDFIVKNSEEILLSSEWITWLQNNTELASEVLSKLTTNLSC